MTTTTLAPCGPFCTVACRAADAGHHEPLALLDPPESTDQVLVAMLRQARVDIADPGPDKTPPATHTGDQRHHDIRAVQLRPDHYSPAMIEKAGRLYVSNGWAYGNAGGQFEAEVCGESGTWYEQRVFGERVWMTTCTCPARASRWNRAGACAHRLLAGYLRAEATRTPIPKWPDFTLEAVR